MGGFAWVTLATNDSYSLGALVLAHSLKAAGTIHQLAVLVTPGVTNAMREKLSSVFNLVQEVNVLDSRDETNLRLLKRPELGITFTKLHCWRLTQYEKCVFLDADTLVMQHCDELFEREELSAAPDVGWPDCFNSGVFVYRPSLETYEKLIQFALEKGSFDGGDQGLLNLFFSDWAHKDISRHLPFIYNMCSTACYSYLPAFKQFGANAKIIHFIGAQKPWLQYFNTETRKVQPSGDSTHLQEVLQRWWDIFCSLIHPQLSPAMAGLAGAFAQLTLGVPRTAEQDAFENLLRKQAWEVGNIDYLGKDSFDNIWSKITETLQAAPEQPIATAPEPAPSAPAQSQSQTAPQQEKVEPVPTKEPTTDTSPVLETPKEQIETAQVSLESPSTPTSQETVKTGKPEPKVAEKEAEPGSAAIDTKTADSVESQPQTLPEIPPTLKDQSAVEPASCPLPGPKETKQEETKVLEPQRVVSEVPQQKESSQEVAACPITQKKEPEPVPIEPIAQAIVEPVCPLPQAKKDDTCPLPSAQKEPEAPTSEAQKEEVPTPQAPEISAPKVEEVPQAALPASEATPPVKEVPKPVSQSTDSEAKEALKPTEPIGLATSQPVVQPTEVSKKPEESADKTLVSDKPSESAVVSTATEPKAAAIVSPTETSKVSEPTVPSSPTPKDAPKAAGSKAASKESPKTKVTEATPPATPSSPTVEKTKQALVAEAEIPETPPPTEGGSTPTPPPRKTDKPKKAAAKPKK